MEFTSGTQALQGRTVRPHAGEIVSVYSDSPATVLLPDSDGAIVREHDDLGETWFPWSSLEHTAVLDNPILASFRRDHTWTLQVALHWLNTYANRINSNPEQIDHARRVLSKLAALA